MEWQTIGSIVGMVTGTTAILIAALALYVSWRVYRRQVVADLPLISVDVHQQAPGWWEVTVTVTNRSGADWQTDDAIIRRPRGAKLTHRRLAQDHAAPYEPVTFKPPDPATLTDRVKPGIVVRRAGLRSDNSLIMGTGDRHSAWLLAFVPPSSSGKRTLSLRLCLSSNEAQPRAMTKDITRTLIEAKSVAT